MTPRDAFLPSRPSLPDRLLRLFCWGSAALIFLGFAWILSNLLENGVQNISLSFLFDRPRDAGRAGGIFPILVSSLWILAVCMMAVFPIGIGAAAFLFGWTRSTRNRSRLIRRSLDILAGIPSIVFGLFGNIFFCEILGFGFSILSGGLTLACMVLPLFIRSVEEGLRAIPPAVSLGTEALGLSKPASFFSILLPLAWPSVLVGFILSVGRALAETAALIFTSGYVDRLPTSILDSGRALSIHIFDLAMNVPGGNQNAYGSALVLITLLLVINGTALSLSKRLVSTEPQTP